MYIVICVYTIIWKSKSESDLKYLKVESSFNENSYVYQLIVWFTFSENLNDNYNYYFNLFFYYGD